LFDLTYPSRAAAKRPSSSTALAEGGQVQVPLAKTPFSSRFGIVADRFGVSWMIIVAPPVQK
jgi:PhnB protein